MWYEKCRRKFREEGDRRGRESRKFLIYSNGFAPEPSYLRTFCNELAGTWHTYTHAHTMVPLWIKKPIHFFFSAPRQLGATRASREMRLEESDFLVFEPLGRKMTYRTISAATIRSRQSPFPSSLPFPSLLMEIIMACSLFAPFKGWDLIYRKRWARVRKRLK